MDLATLRILFLIICMECIILEIYTDYLNSSFKVHRSYAYLTNWGLFLAFLYFYFQILIVWLNLDYKLYKKVISSLFKIAINIQPVICVTFWLLMSPIAFRKIKNDVIQIILNIQTHSLIWLILQLDLRRNQIKIKQKDYLRTWIFYSVYIAFNYVIVQIKGKYIYPLIKYQHYSELVLILGPYLLIYLHNKCMLYYQNHYKTCANSAYQTMQLKQNLGLSYQEHL